MKTIENQPNAASLIQSLRDIGYELDTALADVIDNSITALADKIYINIETAPELKVSIIDNGCGMSQDELISAMKIGSRSPLSKINNKDDLGRFGLGLKTASFSQCKKLTVLTHNGKGLYGACWDLDKVTETNRWELILLSSLESQNIFQKILPGDTKSGTIVIWESCDRLIDSLEVKGDDHILEKFQHAEKHLRLTFHRFLDKSYRQCPNIEIVINNRPIDFIDPFFTKNLATQSHEEEIIDYKNYKISVQAFTLPHHSKCTPNDYERYALDGGYRDNQGFYIYRSNRLLIHGTWFKLYRKSDLTALTRVRIDLPNQLDSYWHIDIKKSHASPPVEIKEQLKRYIIQFIKPSIIVNTTRGHPHKTDYIPVWQKFTNKNQFSYVINSEYPLFKDLRERLNPQDRAQLLDLINIIQTCLPLDPIFADYAADPKSFKKYTDEDLENLAVLRLKSVNSSLIDVDTFSQLLKSTEPFNFYSKDWKNFLKNNKELDHE